jgi:hypothetical protein
MGKRAEDQAALPTSGRIAIFNKFSDSVCKLGFSEYPILEFSYLSQPL